VKSFDVLSMDKFRQIYETMLEIEGEGGRGAVEALFAQHAIEQARMRAQTGGQADYMTSAVYFVNTGPHKLLLGADGVGQELRFKPLQVRWLMSINVVGSCIPR
jgi:hypothetical protein